jgi:adenosylhomocysteine nucleosidase
MSHEPTADAARQQPAGEPQSTIANPRSCDVGIICGKSLESGALEDRLSCVVTLQGAGFVARQGMLSGRRVVVLLAQDPPQQTAASAEALIAGHRPRWVIAAGFASGLDDRLRRGDLLVADSLTRIAGEPLALSRQLEPQWLAAITGLHVGRLLTLDQSVRRPAEKRRLGAEHAALAADVQSLAVAEICRREELPFLAVRVIADAVDDEVPLDIERLANKNNMARRIGALGGMLVRRPSSIKDLWNLYEAALAASLRLAKFLEQVVERLT